MSEADKGTLVLVAMGLIFVVQVLMGLVGFFASRILYEVKSEIEGLRTEDKKIVERLTEYARNEDVREMRKEMREEMKELREDQRQAFSRLFDKLDAMQADVAKKADRATQ